MYRYNAHWVLTCFQASVEFKLWFSVPWFRVCTLYLLSQVWHFCKLLQSLNWGRLVFQILGFICFLSIFYVLTSFLSFYKGWILETWEVNVLIGFSNHTLFLCASFLSLCFLGVLTNFCEVYKGRTWGELGGLLFPSLEFTHCFCVFYKFSSNFKFLQKLNWGELIVLGFKVCTIFLCVFGFFSWWARCSHL